MNHFFKYLVASLWAITGCASAQTIQPHMSVFLVTNEATYNDLGIETYELARYFFDIYQLYQKKLKPAIGVNHESEVVLTINIKAEVKNNLEKCEIDYTACVLMQTNIEHENVPIQTLAQFQNDLEKLKEVKIKNFKSNATATIKVHFTFDDPEGNWI